MLCDSCNDQRNAWLDYRAPFTGWKQYPLNAAREIESYKHQAEQRYKLIRTQIEAIAKTCTAQHQPMVNKALQ